MAERCLLQVEREERDLTIICGSGTTAALLEWVQMDQEHGWEERFLDCCRRASYGMATEKILDEQHCLSNAVPCACDDQDAIALVHMKCRSKVHPRTASSSLLEARGIGWPWACPARCHGQC